MQSSGQAQQAADNFDASNCLLSSRLSVQVRQGFVTERFFFLMQSLGWVEQAACRPYTPSAADSALVSVMPEVAAGGYSPGEDSASHAVCARGLKLAAQYQNANDMQQVGLCDGPVTM